MPRDNFYGWNPSDFIVDESGTLQNQREDGSTLFVGTPTAPNPLTEMFAEKRAKKNGHKSTDKLLLDLKASDEQNSGLRRELNLKTKENTEMKERIKYLEEAILELEGKWGIYYYNVNII